MWTKLTGTYRDAIVSCDLGTNEDEWHWTVRLYRPGTRHLELFQQGLAKSPEQAEQLMQLEVNEYWEWCLEGEES